MPEKEIKERIIERRESERKREKLRIRESNENEVLSS